MAPLTASSTDRALTTGKPTMKIRSAALSALAAIMLAAGANPAPASATPAPAHTIPWSQVGQGWVLATWSPLTGHRPGPMPEGEPDPDTVSTTLYLVDPQGGRYPITAFPPSTKAAPELIDWSGDKDRALFRSVGSDVYTEVDLHTGIQRTITLDKSYSEPSYTLPDGQALLVTSGAYNEPQQLIRLGLDGRQQLTYPVTPDFSGYLSTPDGTELVLGSDSGLSLVGNDGTPGRELAVAGKTSCRPLRFWDTDATVLAKCGGATSQLWLVPIDGSAPTALTAPNDGQTGPDYGDVDAWHLPAGTFVQDLGACGVIYLAKLDADGTTSEVEVPDVTAGTIVVVGVNGDSLRLQVKAACGGGISLVDFDPTTNTTTTLLGSPLNGGGVIDAVAFNGQR
jgi:hypothetical protein